MTIFRCRFCKFLSQNQLKLAFFIAKFPRVNFKLREVLKYQ